MRELENTHKKETYQEEGEDDAPNEKPFPGVKWNECAALGDATLLEDLI